MTLEHAGPLARDFMGKGVVTVPQDSTVQKVVQTMDERNIGSVVVVDSLGPSGVFTERDLIGRVLARGKDPDSTPVSEVISPRFPSIAPTATLDEAATAMIAKKCRLMVFDGADLVGIVTPTDLMKVLKGVEEDFSILKVISTQVVTAIPETPVDAVVRTMDEEKIGSVIVSVGEEWTGIFTERDLVKRIVAKKKALDTPLAKVASSPLVKAEPGIFGREAAGTMALHGFKRLPLWLEGKGVGVVTARDVVQAYSDHKTPRAPKVEWKQWN